MSRYRGMSLIELLLVLAVAGVLLVAVISRYQRYRVTMDAEQVQRSVTLLQQGLTDYFFQYCKTNNPAWAKSSVNVFLTHWQNPAWESKKLALVNPFGSGYEVQITDGRTPQQKHFWLRVYAKLDKINESAMPLYRNMLKASGCVDSQGQDEPSCASKILVWQKLPWYSTPGASSDLWILEGSLQHQSQAAGDVCSGTVK